jgi:hypothetical protein
VNDLVGGDDFGQPELPRARCSWLQPGYLTRTTTDVSGRRDGCVNSQEHKLPTNRVRSLRTQKLVGRTTQSTAPEQRAEGSPTNHRRADDRRRSIW